MKAKNNGHVFVGIAVAVLVALISSDGKTENRNHILNIYDNIAEDGIESIPDEGFSVFIRYNGKTILFDTGTHPDILAHNAKALGADLTSVDIVIISHNHADHIHGLDYLLKVNKDFKLFLPSEDILGAYYNEMDKKYARGYKYRHQNTEYILEHTKIAPGLAIISTTSPLVGRFWKYPPNDNEPLFEKMPELSLALEGENGQVSLISGCSHSKIEEIIKETKKYIGKNVSLAVGGFHHEPYSSEYVHNIARLMKDELRVKYVAPTHCTGEKAIKIFKELYKENCHYFGLGAKLLL